MNFQSLIPTDEPTGNMHKRTMVQRDKDRDFIRLMIVNEPSVTSLTIHKCLLEEVKRRGDNYYLSYTYVTSEVRELKNELLQLTRDNLIETWNDTLEILDEQIKICQQEVAVRFTERTEVTVTEEELSFDDFEGLTQIEIMLIHRYQDKFLKKKTVTRKIRAGQDFRDPMEMLLKFVERRSAMLGHDAPKKISKKVEKEVRKITSIQDLEKKANELGFDTAKLNEALNAKK